MAQWLKQSTSVDVPVGPFLDATDGVTAETALTITQPDVRLKKNGGAWAQKAAAQTLSHEEAGWYEVTLDATDTNTLGLLTVAIAESGALPVWCQFMIVPANVWDSFFGADALQVHAVEISNALITAASIASDAITDAKVASDVTIASVTGAVGSVTGAVGSVTGAVGSVTGAVGSVTAAVSVGALGAGVITAASIAADAITDAKVASDVTIASVTGAVGSVTGAVGSVAGAVGSVTAGVTVTTNNDKTGYALTVAPPTAAQINAEVVDALATDTYAELAAVPAATSTLVAKINWLFALARNKLTQTSTTLTLRNDADNATIAASTVSDDATTFIRGEFS